MKREQDYVWVSTIYRRPDGSRFEESILEEKQSYKIVAVKKRELVNKEVPL